MKLGASKLYASATQTTSSPTFSSSAAWRADSTNPPA